MADASGAAATPTQPSPDGNANVEVDRSTSVFPRARTVGHVSGVAVRLDPSLLIVGLIVVFVYRQQFLDVGPVAAVVMATVAAVLFFASILGHELAHALEGLHRGIRVRGITLFALGGVTEMELDTERARDEFAVSAVGPWSSLVLAAGFGLMAAGADQVGLEPVGRVLGIIGWTNLAVALFNLVPGAPLDGGRVLRSLFWALTGDRHRATTFAARAGQLLSVLLVLAALWVVAGGGDVLSAVWLGVIGLYLLRGATGELRAGRVEARLSVHDAAGLAPAAVVVDGVVPTSEVRDRADRLEDGDVVLVRLDGGTLATALVRDVRTHPEGTTPVAELVGPTITPQRVAGDATARDLASTVDRAGVVAVVLADGTEVLTTRLAVDRRIRDVLDGEPVAAQHVEPDVDPDTDPDVGADVDAGADVGTEGRDGS